ncbi:MAG: DUF3078 domain-containing protein [Eudoraea sp.]
MVIRVFIFFITVFSCHFAYLQDSIPQVDSIPQTVIIDSTIVDTIVIRRTQYRIDVVPRGVNLTNPVISFNQTKVLNEPPKRFKVPSFWTKINRLGFNMSEVAFVNWNAGGDNAISAIGNMRFARNYKFRFINWDNDLSLKYGVNIQEGRKPRKTEDAIRLSSTFGYRNDTLSKWYYSVNLKFNTQFADGFKYPDRENPISTFMAPGYLFFGGGPSFIPEGKNFNLYLSPTTVKATFVLDESLANDGAFGVKKAVFDSNGNLIQKGENQFIEFGILVTNTWEKEIAKNIIMDHRISLFTDYIRRFGNIDIDWEMNFNFKVNSFFEANLGTQIIYDDDILFDTEIADDGTVLNTGVPKIQFRQVLSIGVVYTF